RLAVARARAERGEEVRNDTDVPARAVGLARDLRRRLLLVARAERAGRIPLRERRALHRERRVRPGAPARREDRPGARRPIQSKRGHLSRTLADAEFDSCAPRPCFARRLRERTSAGSRPCLSPSDPTTRSTPSPLRRRR